MHMNLIPNISILLIKYTMSTVENQGNLNFPCYIPFFSATLSLLKANFNTANLMSNPHQETH